jgi:pimeloyl-ACP methyl ester carboxylesterase
VLGCGFVLVGLCFAIYIGRQLVAPVPRSIGLAPDFLGGTTVQFPSRSGSMIHGWLTDVPRADGCILLLHGVRADRRSMADRAKFLRDQGYHTLCIDLQAHGESPGEHITMGYLESMDAAAGVAFLRERHPGLPVAVIGTSLGGASALMADYPEPPEALVVEGVFADAKTAIANRLEMRFGRLGRLLTPLLSCQIQPMLGIDPASLSPVRAAANIKQPVFVIYGAEDQHAGPSEAKAIYAALRGPKEIWEIAGAAHVDLHGFAGAEYEKRVGDFIATHFNRSQTHDPR